MSIAYYISAHGYGHGVRSCDIIQALNSYYPQVHTYIISDLPQAFFRNRLGSKQNSVRAGSFDAGMIQLDSIRVDVDATLEVIKQIHARRKELLAQEQIFLKNSSVKLVVVDIPALPIEAAALSGISRIAVGNFGWDWIYSAYLDINPQWEPIINILRADYAKTDLLLRLPFCEGMTAFPHIEDIPIVASPGRFRRSELIDQTGCNPDKKWILLSFTSLEWCDEALANVASNEDYQFFTVRPLEWRCPNIFCIDRDQIPFSDVLSSVDAVISKPGFGILSECIVNQKPLIYVERKDFLEYQILEDAIIKYLKNIRITAENLYRGNLRESLDCIWGCPAPAEKLPQGGALIAAQRIVQFLK